MESIQVPATVQAILAARIDRLPPEEKQLLQSAAVIGREMVFPLLQAIAESPEDHSVGASRTCKRQNSCTRRACIPSLPTPSNMRSPMTWPIAVSCRGNDLLHARIVDAVERLWADRLTTHVEQLAHHALRGVMWEKALVYCRQAGIKATTRSVHREAVECFAQALAALQHLPETPETWGQAIDLHFDVRNALLPLGDHEQVCEHLAWRRPSPGA